MRNAEPRLLAFGEVMLRLSPPRGELLLQSPRLDVWVAGAEANVATQLAALGRRASLATMLPDNDLGRAAMVCLRGRGVEVDRILKGGDRIGLYFVTPGAGIRSADVLYDRAGSSFADAPPEAWDWPSLLDGVDRLHLSGITPALGQRSADAATAAAEQAASRGIPVSFDGNWRGRLWKRGHADPRTTLDRIVRHVDVLFGDHRDVALLLDLAPFEGSEIERFERFAEAAFDAYPRLTTIAATTRRTSHANHHVLGAGIVTRKEHVRGEELDLSGVVDRIGSGDAFVAGVLDGILGRRDPRSFLPDALALAGLAHSIAGDASAFSRQDVESVLSGQRDVRR